MPQLAEAVTGRARLPVTVAVHGEAQLPLEVKLAFYRIAQEAINNVAKHSQAAQAAVELRCEASVKTLLIQDNGRGFDVARAPSTHLGLNIMRERAEAVGATLSIESQPGRGTRVQARWQGRDG